jgi:hypothetical protein
MKRPVLDFGNWPGSTSGPAGLIWNVMLLKKYLIILLVFFIPCTALGMEEMGDKELDNVAAQFGATAQKAAGDTGMAVAAPSEFAPHVGVAGRVISEAIEANNQTGEISGLVAIPADAAYVGNAVTLGGFF